MKLAQVSFSTQTYLLISIPIYIPFSQNNSYDAGHMVPADKPEVSLDMLKNFLDGGAF
jgi:carboxypeptidase C (cathepsin A)